jgi:hydrogenase maturation protein HypF
MLPYTPLHHILLKDLGRPVIATSGNLSDEPIITDERVALRRLRGVADYFLVHNRPIKRHADDSIGIVLRGRMVVLRRARGLAPFPIKVNKKLPPIIAHGGHLKNTFALSIDDNVFISQHIGDLETKESIDVFREVMEDFERLYQFKPMALACDMHPRYLSTQLAEERSKRDGIPLFKIQHHHAHLASLMAEKGLEGKVLGVTWDGTGYGVDGTVWGGEFLYGDQREFKRVAHFRTFPLPGGDKAIKEPRRVLLGLLFELFGESLIDEFPELKELFTDKELETLIWSCKEGINAPRTSSAGRLFDAVSSLLGIRHRITFEGQAAMELEFAARSTSAKGFEMTLLEEDPLILDWEPMILQLIDERRSGTPIEELSFRFHRTLAEYIGRVASQVGAREVCLTGGVFQNVLLTCLTEDVLKERGFVAVTHGMVPPNDGGISLGQVMVAAAGLEDGTDGG